MRFQDIIGQNEIKEHLQKAISGGKVSHAYIINGEKGMGKRMLAQAFIQTLFCEKHGEDAWEECPECGKISRRNHPDVIYILPEDDKKIPGIDTIRDKLVSDVYIRPYSREIKVYVIPDADLLNPSCQNAILKTIEEPPEYVRLLLLTENAERLLPTIRSRCIRLDLKPVTGEDDRIKDLLMREYELPEYVATSVMQFAQGNIGKALSLAGSDRFQSMLDDVFSLVSHLDSMKAYEISQKAGSIKKNASEAGFDLREYLDLMLLWYRDVLLYKAIADPKRLYFTDRLREIMRESSLYSFDQLKTFIDRIEHTKDLLHANISSDLALSLLMHRIAAAGQ